MSKNIRAQLLRHRLRRDFTYFARYLGYRLAWFHVEMVALAEKHRYVAILAPRGHGKSELMSVLYPLWWAVRYNNKEILIVSSTFAQSKKIIERIKEKVDDDAYLRALLKPRGREDVWSAQELHTKTGCKIIARPFQPSIRGLHVDLAVCDDILQDTDYSVTRSKEIFNSVIMPTVQTKKGKLIVVGTPMAENDIFADFMSEDKYTQFVTRRFAAIYEGRVLWPDRFTPQDLENLKNNMSVFAWFREYLCKPIPAGALLFREEDVQACIDPTIRPAPRARDGYAYYAGIDLAAGADDYTVITVLGAKADGDRPVYAVHYIYRTRDRIAPTELVRLLSELDEEFNFSAIQIEVTGLGQGYYAELVKDPRLSAIVHSFETKRRSKERILSQLEVAIRNRWLRLPDDTDLYHELTSIGLHKVGDRIRLEALRGHDDMVMSLALAYDAAINAAPFRAFFDEIV